MIHLSNTNETLELLTTGSANIEYISSYADNSATAFTPGDSEGIISSATSTTIVSAPASGNIRKVKSIYARNAGTVANTITIKKDVGGTEYRCTPDIPLNPGESIIFSEDTGLQVYMRNGVQKANSSAYEETRTVPLLKIGTAPEAAGVMYCFAKDTGFPGAFAVGTPGVNGRVTDGTVAADAGSISFPDPSSGSAYIRVADISGTVACQFNLFDFLWINTGLGVTTLTVQAITTPTLPARDINGSTNGEGVEAGILVTTATTNAGAIANITISYTNSDGVAGRTGTMSAFPATAVIGTFVPFQLAAGDKGIRSIQSITIGTTLTAGAISLVLFRRVISSPVTLANTGSLQFPKNIDTRVYNRSCLLPVIIPTGTGATTLNGNIYIVTKTP